MRIVEKFLKIDLHIHSVNSFAKDGDKVCDGTEENISTLLVPALEKKSVNMASITDHNAFSYNIYKKLKSFSNVGGSLLCVLPGVELDLDIEDSNKDTHAIAVFDDANDDKVKKIESILKKKKNEIIKREEVDEKHLLFRPSDAIDLFRQIDLNFVLIVHQKSDPDNKYVNQEHNMADLGTQRFNELVSYDYFDAIEFKNYKVEGFLATHKHKYGLEYNALCGSDCHDWNHYPKYDKDDKNETRFCFINALPTFKGLAMALTGDNRIHFSNYDLRKPYLKNIDFTVGGRPYSISLSHGLNVIVGDNSIGKSFFLEMLNNPALDKNVVNDLSFSKKLGGFKNFKKRIAFEITSKTFENDNGVDFHRQGHIRSLFESENKSIEDQPFLAKYFQVIDTSEQEITVKRVIESFIEYSKIISEYNKQKEKVSDLSLDIKPKAKSNLYNLSLLVDKNNLDINDYSKIINSLKLAKQNLSDLQKESLVDKIDADSIFKIVKKIEKLIHKYELKEYFEKNRDEIYSIVVEKINKKNNEISEKSTEEQKLYITYQKEKSDFVGAIANYFLAVFKNQKKEFKIPKKITIKDIKTPYDKYIFISRVKQGVITSDDISNMLVDPIKNYSDFGKIKDMGLDDLMSKLDAETLKLQYSTSVDKYKEACLNYAKTNWFQKEKGSIVLNDKSKITGNSAGLNAQIYLDLYTLLETKKLFIIDQPEDDVSEIRISTELKPIMRRMAEREQILFVTHNAELVVNLDVDNVIIFKNDKDGNLLIQNGALEYEDKEINILNEVANLLDGGAEIIRKRWKRYEKNKDNSQVK